MADWREVAAGERWKAGKQSVRVLLGKRQHTVHVVDHGAEYEFYSRVPFVERLSEVVALLEVNRTAGLAFWHVDDGQPVAMSMCPKHATKRTMATYLRDTAALADRYELKANEIDE